MSYLHRPGGGPPGVGGVGAGAGAGPSGSMQSAPGGGAGASSAAIQTGAHATPLPLQPGAMTSRLSDLLDFVKVEFEAVSSQAETLRRDNHDYAAHGG